MRASSLERSGFDHHEVIGYQADMGGKYWGALYDESRRRKVLSGPDLEEVMKVVKHQDWNEYVIRAEGARIQLWLNGTKTVDFTEADDTIDAASSLKVHSGGPWRPGIRISF